MAPTINKNVPYPGLRWLIAAGIIGASDVHAFDEPAWRAFVGQDPLRVETRCLMESAQVIVHDGQTETPLRFLYNGTAFLVTTESNIDTSYPNVGLQVDTQPPIAIERVHNDTNVVFATEEAQIRTQFLRGRKARLSLGFWPTWPKGDNVVAEFSLIGFTKAYNDFQQCLQTGQVAEDGEDQMLSR